MKSIKIVAGVLLALVLLAAIAIYLLLGNLNSLVQGVIEDVGSEITGTAVTLKGVDIDLSSGSGELKGLEIANPRGYSTAYAFRLKRVAVGIDLKSLTGPVIALNEVTVKGARLNAEQKGQRSNLSDLLENVQRSTGEKPPAEEPTGGPTDVRVALKKFVFANTQATVVTEVDQPREVTVPDVRRRNIGNPEKGLTPAQLGEQLVQAVLEEMKAALGSYLEAQVKEAAEKAVREQVEKELGKSGDGKLKDLGSLLKKD